LLGSFVWVVWSNLTSVNVDCKTRVGMKFDNIDEVRQFSLAYGAHVGFGIKIWYANKNKDDILSSCRFVCSTEGLQKIKKSKCFC